VRPFGFVILFFSFIYALALTHLLPSVTSMIRYRSKVTVSAPLLVWMLVARSNRRRPRFDNAVGRLRHSLLSRF
jgi:hypothetical protein